MASVQERHRSMAAHGFVPAIICAQLGGYALSTLHRAASSNRLAAERVGSLLFINWAAFRNYVGERVASTLPETASAALESARAR